MLEILKILLITFFSIAVLLPVVRYLLRTISPARGLAFLSADEVKYMQKQEMKLTIAYYVFACVLAVFFAGALAMLSSIVHSSSENLFLLTPNFLAMFAPALLLGLTVALLPLRIVQSTLLGHDADMYKSYVRQMEGEKSTKKYGVIFALLLAISAGLILFTLRWHISVTDNGISITNLLNEKREYNFSQIQSIQYLGAEGEYLVTFDDQTNFNTAYLKPVQLEMIALLAERSGHRVIR